MIKSGVEELLDDLKEQKAIISELEGDNSSLKSLNLELEGKGNYSKFWQVMTFVMSVCFIMAVFK